MAFPTKISQTKTIIQETESQGQKYKCLDEALNKQ